MIKMILYSINVRGRTCILPFYVLENNNAVDAVMLLTISLLQLLPIWNVLPTAYTRPIRNFVVRILIEKNVLDALLKEGIIRPSNSEWN